MGRVCSLTFVTEKKAPHNTTLNLHHFDMSQEMKTNDEDISLNI
jgi:hypothetical protein